MFTLLGPQMEEEREREKGTENIFEDGFPGGSDGKESASNEGDLGSILELGRSPGEANGYPLQYLALENYMDHEGHRESDSTERLSLNLIQETLRCGNISGL